MKSSSDFLANLLNRLLPNRAAPVLGRVIKSHEGPGKNKYSVDVRVLKAGSLEETDQVISEVPISPIWATKNKRGVYAIPNEGQVVIIEFLEWNLAYPYVSGIYSDEYEADEFFKEKFIITDGDGMWLIVNSKNKKYTVKNQSESMHSIIKDFMQEVHDMFTMGPPPKHKVSIPDKLKLQKIIKRWKALTED